jgi:hypothetical protein
VENRHRDADGDISRLHGNTQVKTLRRIYGVAFAPGFTPGAKLSDALAMLDDRSLAKLVDDHRAGTLEEKIARSSATFRSRVAEALEAPDPIGDMSGQWASAKRMR